MNVSGIANQYLSLATLRTNSTNSASAVSQSSNVQKALSTATARLEQERQTTTAQISAYGQVKSDFARVQDSGKALVATQSTTSTADVKKNLQRLSAPTTILAAQQRKLLPALPRPQAENCSERFRPTAPAPT